MQHDLIEIVGIKHASTGNRVSTDKYRQQTELALQKNLTKIHELDKDKCNFHSMAAQACTIYA